MTYGADFGGGKGEFVMPAYSTPTNPNWPLELGKRQVLRQIVEKLSGVIGPGLDVPAPDMLTNEDDMRYMVDVYHELNPQDPHWEASFTGLPEGDGGLAGRDEATALSMVYTLRQLLNKEGRNDDEIRGMTAAVQGVGKVGYHFARLARELLGVRVMGVSNADKAVIALPGSEIVVGVARDAMPTGQPDNMQINAGGDILAWNEAACRQLPERDALFDLPVDVFAYAAGFGGQRPILAPRYVEGANWPLPPDLTERYHQLGKHGISGLIANVGGVIGSSIEYDQAMTGVRRSRADTREIIGKVVRDGFDKVITEAGGDLTDLVRANIRVALLGQFIRDYGYDYAA